MTQKSADSRNVADLRKQQPIQALLLTLSFFPLMTVWTILGIVASPFLFMLWKIVTGWEVDRIIRHLIWIHGRGLAVIVSPFVRIKKEGLDDIPRPCILVVNHLSFFDGYYMSTLPFHDITFAVGAWPFKMFWYTIFMRLARYINVENAGWAEAVNTCRRASLKLGCTLFFPEGHRSRTGRLQQFFSGAFRMAVETGIPIVPLCITGTDILLPPGNFWLHPTDIHLKALPPIDPADFAGQGGPTRMRNYVRGIMAKNIKEMRADPFDQDIRTSHI